MLGADRSIMREYGLEKTMTDVRLREGCFIVYIETIYDCQKELHCMFSG